MAEEKTLYGENPPIHKHILAAFMADWYSNQATFYEWLWRQPDPLGEDTRRAYEVGTLLLSMNMTGEAQGHLIEGICHPERVTKKVREEMINPFMEAAWAYLDTSPTPSLGDTLSEEDVALWLEHHGESMRDTLPESFFPRRLTFSIMRHYDDDPLAGEIHFVSTREILGTEKMLDNIYALCDFFSMLTNVPLSEDGSVHRIQEKIKDHLADRLAWREFTPGEMELLAPLASSIISLEEEKALSLMNPMARNMASLSWTKLFTFASLAQEYNVEWAFAAFDWGEEVSLCKVSWR